MESITIFLRDFGYFNIGALVGGLIVGALVMLAFSGPLYWQIKDIARYKKQLDDKDGRIKVLECINKFAQKNKLHAQQEMFAETERANLLEKANENLQTEIGELKAKNLKLYIELDALKAHSFQNDKVKTA